VPASTSKGKGPRRLGPRTAPGPFAPTPPAASGPVRSTTPYTPQPLIASQGPDPNTPVDQVRLAIGVVIGVHGVKGELKVRPLTDDPELFETLTQLFVGDEPGPRRVRGARFHAGNVLLRLAGITRPEAASRLRGAVLRVPGSAVRPLEEGEFLLYQLIGLEARTEQGELLGLVVDLMETGATDVIVIEDQGTKQQILLPYLPEVVLEIDPAAGVMTVQLLEYV
jgi:16S rRNA processing protein RimM